MWQIANYSYWYQLQLLTAGVNTSGTLIQKLLYLYLQTAMVA